MARDPKDPEKVGVYDGTPKKRGGVPAWLTALVIVIAIVLLIVFLL